MRTTPEVWEESIKRMIRLNGVTLKPEEAREIVKYLSKNNGLAPEEGKPIFWEAEHRMFRDQSDKIPDDALQHTCNYCHTIGRVLSQRRTHDDYEKLINMHLGLFPGAENTLHPRRTNNRNEEEMPVNLSAPTGQNPLATPRSPDQSSFCCPTCASSRLTGPVNGSAGSHRSSCAICMPEAWKAVSVSVPGGFAMPADSEPAICADSSDIVPAAVNPPPSLTSRPTFTP